MTLIPGTEFGEEIYAGAETDAIYAFGGSDEVHAGGGNDEVYGGLEGDYLFGDAGDDMLDGGPGNDQLDGNDGTDSLFGGGGDDLLISDPATATFPFDYESFESDIFVGGAGADTFTVRNGATATVKDFNLAEGDSIDLSENTVVYKNEANGDLIFDDNTSYLIVEADPANFDAIIASVGVAEIF